MAHPIHKHMHTHITKRNVEAAIRDNKAHIDYLKRDVLWDNKHGHSDINMTADEKHISKLAGDIKHDKKKEGLSRNSSSPLNIPDYETYIATGGTDPHGGAMPGQISLSKEDLGEKKPKRATGLGSIDFAKKAGTTSMPDKDYEGGQDELDLEAAAKEGLDMLSVDKGINDWQKVVNAKRAAGIGYETEYQTDKDGNTISGLRFEDGTFLPD